MKLYSIFDVKSGEYMAPFEAANDVAATRSIIDLLLRNPAENRFLRHREDYVLHALADFDIFTGVFTAHTPRTLMTLTAAYDSYTAQRGVPNAQ